MVFAIVVFGGITAIAQVSVNLNDQVVARGEDLIFNLPCVLPSSLNKLDSVRLVLSYNPSLYFPRFATGGAPRIMLCPMPALTVTPLTRTTGRLSLSCTLVQRPTTDTTSFCAIMFTSLVAADSVGIISLDSVYFNNQSIPITGKKNAVITVRQTVGLAVTFTNVLGQNYPNPVAQTTTFDYAVSEDTPVHFALYDLSGRLITEYPEIQRSRGAYTFEMKLSAAVISNGVYLVRLKTNSGVLYRAIQIFR